ncbi:PREDICTED: putative quinone-oxidoreductase homolog, chloroplastic [Ipomoea nil]|uniref:putative quinone-oxidoreductase homolog, chloroplastic n=1 Tax=Ipomoea nil TaxID=35883 RepID=UPI0009008845|nr:PREDICTED: putative quinone-oxidoreductase homolog, chloroplastic [Ipomoea nil]
MAERRLMHAVQYDSYGGGAVALKHVEVPVPTPGKGEVLLKIEARSLNPFDCRIQSGIIPFLPQKFPYIPATDVAGEVMEVGSDVTNFKPGNKVVAVLSARNGGGLGGYALAKENSVVARPPEVSAAEAAGLPIAGVTAYLALTEAAGIKLDGPKKNILVTAASGGVGHYAVQLAKLGNQHHVTATCGTRNIDFVKSLGADEVVDYTTPEGTGLKSPSGLKYDVVIHCARGIPWSTFKANLSKNGKVIDLTPNPKAFCIFAWHKLTFSKKQLLPCIITPKSESLAWLVGLVKEGKLKTTIDSTHPLSKAEDAWAKMMSGHATGKIIVET